MIDKSFDKIAEEDLQRLVENKISEKKNLEYKADLPLISDQDKIRWPCQLMFAISGPS